jgi:hypothetical protein
MSTSRPEIPAPGAVIDGESTSPCSDPARDIPPLAQPDSAESATALRQSAHARHHPLEPVEPTRHVSISPLPQSRSRRQCGLRRHIVTNIDRRLAGLHAEVAHLEGARLALINGSQPGPAPKGRRARSKPAEPKYQVVPAGKLTALLVGTDGLRTAELAKATNGDPAQVLTLLKEQESAGEVRRTGTRAATRWHVISEEARIVGRATDLNTQSRRTRARKT